MVLSLEGKAQELALELSSADITADDGANNVIKKLDTMYKKDALVEKFCDIEAYETYKRPSDTNMKDFIIEFEKRLYKVMELHQMMTCQHIGYSRQPIFLLHTNNSLKQQLTI